ncbi:hypothetical protein, partial [Bifidobacterium reuteri]
VLFQCLFDRFGSVFPQCGLMVFRSFGSVREWCGEASARRLYIPECQFDLVSVGCRWPKAREGKDYGDTDAHGAGYQET